MIHCTETLQATCTARLCYAGQLLLLPCLEAAVLICVAVGDLAHSTSYTHDDHLHLLTCLPPQLIVSFIEVLHESKGSWLSSVTPMLDICSHEKQLYMHKGSSSRQAMPKPKHSVRAFVLQRCWDGRKPWGCYWRPYSSCPLPLTGVWQRHVCTVSSELHLTSRLFLHK